MALAAPVLPGTANPLIEDAAAPELHDVFELEDEIGELGIGFRCLELVRDLERDRHDGRAVVGKRRLGHQDLVIPIGQPPHDLAGVFLAREIEKELLDVLDLERSLLEPILPNQIFHWHL